MKIKITLIFVLFSLFLNAQVDNHLSIERGSTTTLTWKAAGDYSSYDSLYFVVKPCTSNTCARLIQKKTSVSYSEPYTTMACTIYVDETASFNAARYFYSIYAYGADTVWVTSGNFNLMLNGQTPTDGVPTTSPYYTVALDPPVHDPAFIIGDSSADSWNQIDTDSMRALLNLDTNSVDANFDSLYTYWVNKHEAQTITGQKNFTGTIPIKLGSDTTLRLGGLSNGVPIGLLKTENAADVDQYRWYQLTHADTSTVGDWLIYSLFLDWDANRVGTFTNYCIAYNGLRRGNKAWMGTAMEPEYEVVGNHQVLYEWWYGFDYPATNIQYTNRPFQVTQYVPYSGNIDSIIAGAVFSLDQLWMGTPAQAGYCLDFQFNDVGGSYVRMADSFQVVNSVNNIDWLLQANTSGSHISLMKLNELNQIVLAPAGEYRIKLGTQLTGPIRWMAADGYTNISIEPDSTDRIIFSNESGITVTSLKVRGFATDTTGLDVGDLVADPNSGVLSTVLGANLISNGDFSNWTAWKPDDWTVNTPDTTNWYLENDGGKLHFIVQTNSSEQVYQGSRTAGKTYGYSFLVTQVVDTFNVLIATLGLEQVTQTGFYSGTAVATEGGNLLSIVPANGACEITIDNIRVWDIAGAKQDIYNIEDVPLNIFSPTISDTVFLGRKGTGAFYDSLAVFDIVDSIAIQVYYDDGTNHNLITTPDTLTTDTTIAFDVQTIPDNAKVYLCFVYLGDSEAYLRSQIYWRE